MYDKQINDLSNQVIDIFKQNKIKLITIESCTGGMLSSYLTNISGSSSVLEGGFVTYSNEMKIHSVGVDKDILQKFGAVSVETAQAMADGGLKLFSKDHVAISITGIAGPEGGTPQKPVGTVCFGLASTRLKTITKKMQFRGDRNQIRQQAVKFSLELLLNKNLCP
ncbi:CinA family protein [Swingsia samuiensis]|uniref:CinA family protein n=1 Tax=Swingsia samuiensis TaxID=1293412 RepID=A0A4Y6UN69_9PROT|nr:CinA family protein [Swingsia samuiensis]QDH17836.1 CinA family protein [Swingsia samuiensis]